MSAQPYYFGRFTLDPAERRLYADGAPVPVGAKAIAILLALVEDAGTVVSKDELMSRVWGHAAVGDSRLHVHVNVLRKFIGDGLIATKQGRGYRFVANVQRSPELLPPSVPLPIGNLPSLWTAREGPHRLIGRTRELSRISELLKQGRLVTLSGPGGVGKTRLGVQAAGDVAMHFADGVWLVELAALKDPNLMPAAVASALGLKEGNFASPLETLKSYLARKQLLLVLDNCEHMIVRASRLCDTVLDAAWDVKVLATSREALSCSAEQIFEVPPLEVPGKETPPTEMHATAAIELFAERARAANADFRMDDAEVLTAAKICGQLDGSPLAIEMVAGWAGILGIDALKTEFSGPATVWMRAGNSAPARHATLGATLEWSYDLLSSAERKALCRLAVFADSFTLAAAKSVVGDSDIPESGVFGLLGSLIRKSMVAIVPGTQRYRLLETTRVFMLEKLNASGEAETLRRRHTTFVLQFLEDADIVRETASDEVWLQRYKPLLDDLRRALDWAMERDTEQAIALAGVSLSLWRELSLSAEGQQRMGAAVALLDCTTPPALEARLRFGLGALWSNTAAVKAAHADLARAIELYRTLDDPPNLASALTAMAHTLLMLGQIEEAERVVLEARALLESAQRPKTLALAYSTQLCIETRLGHFESAHALGEKAHWVRETAGEHRALIFESNLVEATLEMGDIEDAVLRGRSTVEHWRGTPYTDIYGFVLGIFSAALIANGDLNESLLAAREASPLLRDHGMLFWLFDHLALRAGLAGRLEDAALLAGYSEAAYRKFDRPREVVGKRAIERLNGLLGGAMPPAKSKHFCEMGARLNEEQALAIALR